MAIFFHGNRSIKYHSQFAPFAHDLLLLQNSSGTPEYWQPLLEDMRDDEKSSGRIVTCEWHDAKLDVAVMAEDLNGFLQTLGLQALHVVAMGDAVRVISELERRHPGAVDKTLLFPHAAPQIGEVLQAVREFSGV